MDSKTLKSLAQGIVVTTGLVAAATTHAVEPTIYQLGDGGAVAPHVRVEFGNDNNPLRSTSGSQETLYVRLQPSLEYLVQRRNNRLTLGYRGDYYQYFEEYCQGQTGVLRPGDCLQGSPTFDKASYQDHTLSLNGFLEVSKRLRATLELSQIIEHQPLGTGLSGNRGVLDSLTSPENWNRQRARAQLSYGAFQARGEVRVGIGLSNNELQSERNVDLDAQSDTSVAPFASILYRVGNQTQFLAGVSADQVRDSISFNPDGTVNNNNERDISRLSFGVELDPNAVTSGSVAVSLVEEDFLAGNRDDLSYLGWDVNLIWRPRRFSTVTISGGRQTEGNGFRDLSLSSSLGASWVHFWQERLSTRVQLEFENSEDVDAFAQLNANSVTEDDTVLFRFEGNYNVRRWLDIGGFVVVNSRDGFGDTRDFERTVIGITANGTI